MLQFLSRQCRGKSKDCHTEAKWKLRAFHWLREKLSHVMLHESCHMLRLVLAQPKAVTCYGCSVGDAKDNAKAMLKTIRMTMLNGILKAML